MAAERKSLPKLSLHWRFATHVRGCLTRKQGPKDTRFRPLCGLAGMLTVGSYTRRRTSGQAEQKPAHRGLGWGTQICRGGPGG